MEWHHLTGLIPHAIHLVTCPPKQFKILSNKLAADDFIAPENMPGVPFPHHRINEKVIMTYTIHEHSRKNYKSMPIQKDSGGIKVAPVGQTFLDMLKEPNFCGGIHHVLEVFEEHAERYLPLIIRTTEKQGSTIDKMRVGYLLEEHFRFAKKTPTVENWKKLAQRGGSRILVAGEPYANTFSETWCLSINLPNGN
jgi:predicted transcriptional regulator of viral defense system